MLNWARAHPSSITKINFLSTLTLSIHRSVASIQSKYFSIMSSTPTSQPPSVLSHRPHHRFLSSHHPPLDFELATELISEPASVVSYLQHRILLWLIFFISEVVNVAQQHRSWVEIKVEIVFISEDERCSKLKMYPILQKVYLERILRKPEIDAFAEELKAHQKALFPDQFTVLDHAMIEHNLLSSRKLYKNISFEELGGY